MKAALSPQALVLRQTAKAGSLQRQADRHVAVAETPVPRHARVVGMRRSLDRLRWPRDVTRTSLAALALGLCFSSSASAAPAPTEATAPITLSGEGPYHRLTLPAAIYSHAAHADLRDLRIRNAQDDAVPYAWLREMPSPRTVSQAAPLFPVPGHAVGAEGASPAFKIGADGTLRLIEPPRSGAPAPAAGTDWLIDASQVSGQLLQARLELAPESEGVFGFTLQASDDLRHWRPVGGVQQLVRLRHQERTLEQLSVDLGGTRARFLRLRWRDPAQGAALAAVHIESQQAVEIKPQQEWSDALAPAHCSVDACDYLAPRGWPAQSLRIELAQANTLAQVQVSGLIDAPPAAAPASQPPRLLPTLRHPHLHRRETPSAAPGPQEIVLADTVLYRLSRDGQEVRSPALALDGVVYPRLRLRTQGPISQLGSAPPTLEFGVTPRTLVFLAQGQPPFRLAWQSAAPDQGAPVLPDGGAMALATLMPGGTATQALTADTAQVRLPGAPAALMAPASAPTGPAGKADGLAARPLWLWAALGAGLLLLAGMAWSLFASLKKSESSKSDA